MFNWKKSPNPLTADSDDDESDDPYMAPVIDLGDEEFDGSMATADGEGGRALTKGGAKSVPDWLKAPPGKDAAPSAEAAGTSLFEDIDEVEGDDTGAARSPVAELPGDLADAADAGTAPVLEEDLQEAIAALEEDGADATEPGAAEARDNALAEEVEALRIRFHETHDAFHSRVTEEMENLRTTFSETLDNMATRVQGLESEVEAWERKVVEKDTEIARLKTALKGLISQASSLVENKSKADDGEED